MPIQNRTKGFSLIEIMIALGIFSFVSMAFASYMSHTSRELRASNQKIEMISLERDLEMATRMNTTLCSSIVDGLTFDASNLTDPSSPRPKLALNDGISLSDNSIVAKPGDPLPGSTTGLVVDQVFLEIETDLAPVNPDIYSGFFVIQMESSSMVRALQPVKFRYYFLADSASPLDSRELISCSPHPLGQGCDPPEIQVGMYSNGDAICTTLAQQMGSGCPPGSYLQGVAPNGSWICNPLPTAPSQPTDPTDPDEPGSCTAPDGTVVASGEWAHGKWVAFASEVGCSPQSAKCEDGAWTSNTINPVNKDGSPLPSFELYLTPDQCAGVGRCGWSSDTYVVQTGITQATCENTYYTGGYHQAVRGTWYIHGSTDGSFGAMLNAGTKSNCGITTGTPYCWWDD